MTDINDSSDKLNAALAKEAILEILKAIDDDPKLKQMKENCANDMLKYIQTFVPHSMDVQFKIIQKYGFSPNNDGLISFTNRIKELAIEDDCVANLFDNFKNMLIPPLNIRTQCV